ncbi:MAG TPA: response regulator [Myxococcaceae bacterium]
MSEHTSKRRILVIDDSDAIHKDFRRVLSPERKSSLAELAQLEDELFGVTSEVPPPSEELFEVDSAFQGREGLEKVREALASGRPYALVFLDYLMPPGWSGVETLREIRKLTATVPVVICSAYTDYSWEELTREFGEGPLLSELRKPFNHQELYQLALRLTG